MLLTHVGFFSKTGSDTFRSVLISGKEQESGKKMCQYRAEKIVFPRRFDRRNTLLLDIKKSNSKYLFSNDSKCKTVLHYICSCLYRDTPSM